jgi:3-isopropylmalate dehydratase small subunit
MLLNGYDEIELSLLKKNEIAAYEKKMSVEHPWL